MRNRFIRNFEYIASFPTCDPTQISVHDSKRPNNVTVSRSLTPRAMFITHEAFVEPGWGALHPLNLARHRSVLALCDALGWLPNDLRLDGRVAGRAELERFHEPDYVAALEAADARGAVTADERARFGFGTMENPLFPGVYRRAGATVGCAVDAARRALDGGVVFHPAGGTHHGRPDRASGFCYFNDPAFAIATFLDAGAAPVLYVDLDAHHGDGVQDLFADAGDVFLISVHERDRWPHSGGRDDRGGGNARNLPVPRRFNDTELKLLMDEAVAPLAARIRPRAVVVTAGADALAGDPLSGLELSNVAFWDAVERAAGFAPSAVVLGGGGYNPWTVARAWTGLWGRLAGFPLPDELPSAARAILAGFTSDLIDDDEIEPRWLDRLDDAPNEGPVRDEIRSAAARALEP
jgi:acetoin utilization protein AcuC